MIINIPIEPVAQERPRFAHRGRFIHAYDPKKSRIYKKQVAQFVKNRYKGDLIDYPVQINYVFYRPCLKSFTKAQREAALAGNLLPESKPDVDNYIKSTQDALIGSILKDDNIVIAISGEKTYGKSPAVIIKIQDLRDE